MTQTSKLVAALLAFIFLTSGLSAFGASLAAKDAATMQQCCGSHCPMLMKSDSTGANLQVKAAGTSCCNVSPEKPLPASVAEASCTRASAASLLAATEPLGSSPWATKKELRDGAPPDEIPPPLAVLCVFLL